MPDLLARPDFSHAMPTFFPGLEMFALAGAVAAAGPVIIHLLNRRRFRTVPWAAMDFLREAMKRNRRILQIRDILLLILRTAAVLLFGLALARPYFASSGSTQINPGQPLHAILLVDNSMSMGYRQGSESLLDEAKTRGHELIKILPEGSRITVLPLCGGSFSRDPYRTPRDADEALDKIELTDRSTTAARAIDLAKEGMLQASDVDPSARRIVLLSDEQGENWKGASLSSRLDGLPEIQVVDVAARNTENAWVSDFRLLDGLADTSVPARFISHVSFQGKAPRSHVQVTLSVDGVEAQSKTIDLSPDQTAEVNFEYQFTDPPEAGQVRWHAAKVSLPTDNLSADDSRSLVVPVVAALPVIFVDQYGEAEDPKQNKRGETSRLRALLAPQNVRGQPQEHLIRIIRRRIDQLDTKELREARMVVIAGVPRPDSLDAVRLLRDYVRQGGQLILAAGGDFDPAAWTQQAWLDGAGILPLPLQSQPLGHTPEESTTDFRIFSLKVSPSDVASNASLQLPETEPQDVADSLREPTFFKAVVPLEDKEVVDKMLVAETKRIQDERTKLVDVNAEIQKLSEKELRGQLDAADRQSLERAQKQRDEIVPNWLLFDSRRDRVADDTSADELAARSRPKVELRFDNQVPFLVQRQIGRGQVLMFTSGFQSSWNDFPRKNAIWLVERILRDRIESTLPERNVDTSAKPVLVPINASLRNEPFYLVRPNGKDQLLEVERIGRDQFGVSVGDFAQRGVYRVSLRRPESAADSAGNKPAGGDAVATVTTKSDRSENPVEKNWRDELIAANGPADESKLASIDEAALAQRMKVDAGQTQPHFRWVPRGESISLSGAAVWGQDMWWWLILAVLVALLAELLFLAWPTLAPARETT